MADSRFFKKSTKLSLKNILKLCKLQVPIKNFKDKTFVDLSSLDNSNNNHITFFDNILYLNQLKKTKAGACFLKKEFLKYCPRNTLPIIVNNPYHCFAVVTNSFYPLKKNMSGVHPKAFINKNVKLNKSILIGPGSVISENVKIGNDCQIGSNTVILPGVVIGNETHIGSNCTIGYSILGNNVIIHNGVNLGQDGFGFAQLNNENLKVQQLGRVIIKNKVEIGANTTVDRGSGPDTIISEGTKIDNLVQIGHNVIIGKNCIIVAQSGISGSTTIGNNVMIGGQVGIAGHLKIGNNVKIAAKSGVMKNISDGSIMGGIPAVQIKNWHKQTIIMKQLIEKRFDDK